MVRSNHPCSTQRNFEQPQIIPELRYKFVRFNVLWSSLVVASREGFPAGLAEPRFDGWRASFAISIALMALLIVRFGALFA